MAFVFLYKIFFFNLLRTCHQQKIFEFKFVKFIVPPEAIYLTDYQVAMMFLHVLYIFGIFCRQFRQTFSLRMLENVSYFNFYVFWLLSHFVSS